MADPAEQATGIPVGVRDVAPHRGAFDGATPLQSGVGLHRRIVLSLVERGWQAARECSLDPKWRGLEFLHVIKGRVDPAVLALIAPQPNGRIISVPNALFWPWIWLLSFWLLLTGRLRALLVDNDRSFRRLDGWIRAGAVHLVKVWQGSDAACIDL